jgi:hypothetical protein
LVSALVTTARRPSRTITSRGLAAIRNLRRHPYQGSAPGPVSPGSPVRPGERRTARDRCEPLGSDGVDQTWTKLGSMGFPVRPVADTSGAPVLRDQGPIGRRGTARPILKLA